MIRAEMTGFDGDQVQADLLATPSRSYEHTQISVSTMRYGCFVVLVGTDTGRSAFSDTEIQTIFDTFDAVIAAHPVADATLLRTLAATALAPLWTLTPPFGTCPYDMTVAGSTRVVFYLSFDGWTFEPARIKLKSTSAPGEFAALTWLSLNGVSQEPLAFSFVDSCVQTHESFEYALYINAAQDSGAQNTRIVIDPIIKNED